MDYLVLLYYRFVPVPDPEMIRDEQEAVCENLALKGRILIAGEGINGTVSGPREACEKYMDFMNQHPVFQGIEFKIDACENHTFLKLHVRVKDEIVRLEAENLELPLKPVNYIEPEAFREVLKKAETDENIVILDARSNYETNVGKFKNALTLDIENFRELPAKLEELAHLKGKTIYTYCTGGIKCEKVSALMEREGFEKVYQLHGGIVRYGHEVGGEDFEGACYVFDQRVVVPVNTVNPVKIGTCAVCEKDRSDLMINCANPDCNAHFLICADCLEQMEGCCSKACMEHPKRRVFDGRGYYLRGVNSKLYVQNPDPNYLKVAQTKEKD